MTSLIVVGTDTDSGKTGFCQQGLAIAADPFCLRHGVTGCHDLT